MSRLPIYQNPQTPAHWRAVLNAIQTNLGQDDTSITIIMEALFAEGTSSGAVTAGQALYVPSNGTVAPARANTLASSRVAGFATETTSGAGVAPYQSVGIITRSGIVAAQKYYLSAVTAGLLVTTPDAVAGQFLVLVGWGVATDKLLFVPHSPILL